MFQFTIGKRLGLGFGLVAVIALLLGLAGYYGAVKSGQTIAEIGENRLPSLQSLLIVSEAQTAVDSGENALLSPSLDTRGREAQHQRFVAAKQRADAAWKIYEPLPQTPEEEVVWKQFVPAWDRWWKDHQDYVKLVREFEATGVRDPERLLKNLFEVRGAFWKTIAVLTRHFQSGAPLTDEDRLNTPLAGSGPNWLDQINTDNAAINQSLRQIQPLNTALMSSVQNIRQALERGEKESAEAEFTRTLYPNALKLIELMRPLRQESQRAIQLLERINQQALVTNSKSFAAAEALLNKLVEINDKAAVDTTHEAVQAASFAKVFNMAATGFGVALALILAALITRSVVAPLKEIVALLGLPARFPPRCAGVVTKPATWPGRCRRWAKSCGGSSGKSPNPLVKSVPRPARSPRAALICPNVPKNRPRPWKKPLPRWKN